MALICRYFLPTLPVVLGVNNTKWSVLNIEGGPDILGVIYAIGSQIGIIS